MGAPTGSTAASVRVVCSTKAVRMPRGYNAALAEVTNDSFETPKLCIA